MVRGWDKKSLIEDNYFLDKDNKKNNTVLYKTVDTARENLERR